MSPTAPPDSAPSDSPELVPIACPVCRDDLEPDVEKGVRIDVCPEHGIWLDSGELEAIVEKHVARERLASLREAQTQYRRAALAGAFFGLLQDPSVVHAVAPATLHGRGPRNPVRTEHRDLKCPVCEETLLAEVEERVQIEFCAHHGVWIEPQALETIIRRRSNRVRRSVGAARRRGRLNGIIWKWLELLP